MRRAALAIMTTIAGLVGLLSFKTESLGSTATPSALSTQTGHSSAPVAPTPSSSSATTKKVASGGAKSSKKKAATSSSSASTTRTATGSVVETQFGPVQVKITVVNGKVTAATAVQYPNGDPRSQQINEYAIPTLERETVGSSSASSVDMVSGATYTSDGYLQSLQSALDQVGP